MRMRNGIIVLRCSGEGRGESWLEDVNGVGRLLRWGMGVKNNLGKMGKRKLRPNSIRKNYKDDRLVYCAAVGTDVSQEVH